MKVTLAVLVFCLSASIALAKDISILGQKIERTSEFYGSLNAPHDLTENDGKNVKLNIYFRPSITLKHFSDSTKLVAYSIVSFQKDKLGLEYENKSTTSLGLELQHKLNKSVRLSFGAKWKTEYEFLTGKQRSRLVITADASLYKTWQPDWLPKRLPPQSRFVLSGWANYRSPGSLHASERKNGQAQAAAKFALEIPFKSAPLRVAPFVSFKVKADRLGRAFNNTVEPAFGVEIERPFTTGGGIALGAKLARQWRHSVGSVKTGQTVYVKWYRKY